VSGLVSTVDTQEVTGNGDLGQVGSTILLVVEDAALEEISTSCLGSEDAVADERRSALTDEGDRDEVLALRGHGLELILALDLVDTEVDLAGVAELLELLHVWQGGESACK